MLKKIYQKFISDQDKNYLQHKPYLDDNSSFFLTKNHNHKIDKNSNISKSSKNIKNAFSLIEISIVILIIGILISGVTTFSRLVKQMKLTSIKQLTYSSAVPAIKGLSLWLETSLDGSVSGVSNPLSPDENEKIIAWNDINPQSSSRIFVTQTTDAQRPIYTTIGTINELPALRFDGSQFLSSIKASGGNIPLAQGDDSFTMIAVWQTNINSGVNQVVIDQNSTLETANTRAGILLTLFGTYGFCGQANDYWTCQSYLTKTPYISAITVADNGAVKIYTNSTTANCSSTINTTNLNISDQGFYVGVKGSSTGTERMNGIIQEAIVYDRVLSDDELRDVLRYLSKKFTIKIN